MVNNSILRQLYAGLNLQHFNGELPNDLPVQWNHRCKGIAGYAYYDRVNGHLVATKIELSAKVFAALDWDIDKITRTLIHEMVHCYLYNKFNERGHTVRFQNLMCIITGEVKNHRCHDYDLSSIKNIHGTCNCGYQHKRHRMPRRGYVYTCKKCGGVIEYRRVA